MPEEITATQPVDVLPIHHEQPALATVGTGAPVLAEIKLQDKPAVLVSAADKLTKAPDTTDEENRKTAGQRQINFIWEVTQGLIALMVTGAVIYSSLRGVESQILGNAFTLIIAIYFVRMNHIKTGGVGGEQAGMR